MDDQSDPLKAAQALTDKIMTGVRASRRWFDRVSGWILVGALVIFAVMTSIFVPIAVALGWASWTDGLLLLGGAAGCAGLAYGIWYWRLSGKPLPAYVWGVLFAVFLVLITSPTQRARIAEAWQETGIRRTLCKAYVSTSPGKTRADFNVCQELPR
jgi:hypothetical protein